MTREEKIRVFEPLTENFETKEMKLYYLDMVAEMPDYIFTMPSSTSGKFHNKTQCETFGQIYHEYMFDSILNHRLRLKGNQEKFPDPIVRDCMRCTPTFHDAVKCGWNGSKYTVQNHPMLAAEWVKNTKVEHDIDEKYKEIIAIAGMCEAHSGQWNKSRAGKEIMSEPRNDMEFFIHECDILSSRADIDMIIPEKLKNILEDYKEELPGLDNFIMPYGKHKGKTIPEIAAFAPDYISWMKTQSMKEPIPSLLKIMEEKKTG